MFIGAVTTVTTSRIGPQMGTGILTEGNEGHEEESFLPRTLLFDVTVVTVVTRDQITGRPKDQGLKDQRTMTAGTLSQKVTKVTKKKVFSPHPVF